MCVCVSVRTCVCLSEGSESANEWAYKGINELEGREARRQVGRQAGRQAYTHTYVLTYVHRYIHAYLQTHIHTCT